MEYRHGSSDETGRMPGWMRRPLAKPGRTASVEETLGTLRLNTVCRSARCPNRGECYSTGTATFLVLGDRCTRGCRFCAVDAAVPRAPEADEPQRVARAAASMGLRHVVVTMVTRDDLADGGAGHVAEVVRAVREAVPGASVEVLVSDLGGDAQALESVVQAAPDVFAHNVETVPRLYARVRPQASYERSLGVLAAAGRLRPSMPTKSGLMVGLGESREEVLEVLADLRAAGVAIVTIGQYLRPSARHLPVERFVEPTEFDDYERAAKELGFAAVASAPFVRSSYRAAEAARSVQQRHGAGERGSGQGGELPAAG